MNFIEGIFDSIDIGLKRIIGIYPEEINSYCIGSGSNFTIHRFISYEEALEIYKKYKENLQCLGKIKEKKQVANFILEKWHTLESQTGYTYTFMFKITEIIEHNPNKIIDEWIEKDRKNKKCIQDILKDIESKRKEND